MTIGDARMLDIALTNLLENSYKFTGKLPHARIEFGMTMIEGKPTYWVKDNGVGFDMENSKNLFGVFQRMHNQNEFPGTGIGLATVQRIIHRHNGIIWADSRINEGTTFFFTIPNVNL
jgi:light-regulated signal transduction histidine kinase (bacteriophytochrome)